MRPHRTALPIDTAVASSQTPPMYWPRLAARNLSGAGKVEIRKSEPLCFRVVASQASGTGMQQQSVGNSQMHPDRREGNP